MTDKITIDRSLLEQALEALDADPSRNLWAVARDRRRAIAALRSALEQPQQEPVAWMMVNPTHLPSSRSLHWEPQDWHITWQAVPLYTAPPAPQQERPYLSPKLRAVLEQPQQKPDIYPDEAYEMGLERIAYYTAPPAPRRLTDEAIWLEYQTLWPFHPHEEKRLAADIVKFARAIEARILEGKP